MNERTSKHQTRRRGFGIMELVVVGSVLFIVLATLLPALLSARQAARRVQCSNNLHQIGTALANYHSDMNLYPPGCVNETGPVTNSPDGYQLGWIVQLLPRLEQYNLYQTIDFSEGVHGSHNAGNMQIGSTQLATLMCPSNPQGSSLVASSSYAGCIGGADREIDSDNSGTMYLNSSISQRQIADGLSNTILVGETRYDEGLAELGLGWTSGSASTLSSTAWPVNGEFVDIYSNESGGFGSYHGEMAIVLFADGSVRPLAAEIDPRVLQNLGDRSDGELVSVRTQRDADRDEQRAKYLQQQIRKAER